MEMLSSFRKGIVELLENKEIKKKKVLKLVDWLLDGILSIYPRDKLQDLTLGTE